jgi:CubicO group peptidase (beta-lactamase class C family)
MRARSAALVLPLVLLALAGGAAPILGQASPQTPAERRVAELARLMEATEPAVLSTYIRQSFAPTLLQRSSPERYLNLLGSMAHYSRGWQVESVESASPGEVSALVVGRLTGEWARLRLQVEPEPPHRIAMFSLQPVPPPAGAVEPAPAEDAGRAAALDSYVRRLCDADLFSGAVLLARGEQVLYRHACGEASRDFGVPNREDTRFNLGSMNKMVTAVAIAQLQEAGRLSYSDPLSRFAPDLLASGAAERVRIEHLLTHTSGLGSYFNQRFRESSRARWRTVDEFLELARGDSLRFDPGSRWDYSNTGYLLLGKVIEVVSGMEYSDYVREHVYRPAGMSATGEFDLDSVNPNLAVGYDRTFTETGVVFRNNLFEHVVRGGPAGGGYSTVDDLHRFAVALLDGRLVSPATVRLLTSTKPELGSPHYGFGFGMFPDGGFGHTGGFPGISSRLDILPGGYLLVALSNLSQGSEPLGQRVRELVR